MRRQLPNALLALLGVALLRISLFSDLSLRYVKEGLRPLLIVSGALLVLLGLACAVQELRTRSHDHGDDAEDDAGQDGHHGHRHPAGGPRTAWLLALPAVMLLLFAPPALGAYTAARDGSGAVALRSHTTFAALPADGVPALSLSDFTARAAWDEAESLKGRTVRLEGFAVPGRDGTWQLARLIVSCCAADARVVKVEVRGVAAPSADSWVTVTGVWHPGPGVPALDATELTPMARPENPYRDTAPS
ncbi:TIGR03943 family putative permease subunit [Streptomyces sp. NPDC004069]